MIINKPNCIFYIGDNNMSKMDEFKKFVSDKSYLKDKINRKETTWQELYEHYDLYGENDEIFKESNQDNGGKEKYDKGLNGIFDMLSGIDIDKIADGLNGMRKVLGIISELTSSQDEKVKERNSKPFNRVDD